jgi:hypothetical protein
VSNDPTEQRASSYPGVGWFVLALLGVVFLQVLYGFAVVYLSGPNMDTRGQFGDMFGGINALFTGLAFAGVIYTILLQRRDLELQRDELRLTREELHTSAEAQKGQVSQLEQAAHLSALTALLNVYSTDLQPLRETIRPIRRQLADYKARYRTVPPNTDQSKEVASYIREFEQQIADLEAEWSTMLSKHDELVERLKTLVERMSQGGLPLGFKQNCEALVSENLLTR